MNSTMNSTWGKNLTVSIFGESHSEVIGTVINGLPAGIKLDMNLINHNLQKRAGGNNSYSTSRKESDIPNIVSGVLDGVTTGAPLCCLFENRNTQSGDYENLKNIPRPGHSDFTAYIKYKGNNDIRGGGHFSGRLTTPLVFAGSICQQILKENGINIITKIAEIHGICDTPLECVNITEDLIESKEFPVISDEAGTQMIEEIKKAKEQGNSVGGIIEGSITGINAGIGNPIFHSVESVLSSIFFSVPAVKGVEFGIGFGVSRLTATENNDCYYYDEMIKTQTNNCGGILGGITNGMPVTFRIAIKPTPSISSPQQSINLKDNTAVTLKIQGRHDPCIVPRANIVIKAAAAIGIIDLLMEDGVLLK